MHAELVGREFLRMGDSLTVFAPYVESASRWWHHRLIKEDEEYVVRCYEEVDPAGRGGRVDMDTILGHEFDALIVESYASLPYGDVEKLVERLKGRAKVLLVVHEGGPEQLRYTDLEVFDRVVVFDERYVREVVRGRVSEDRLAIVPFPCHPVAPPPEPRRHIGKVRFFSFGRQPVREYAPYIEALDRLSREYELEYLVVRADDKRLQVEREWLVQRMERLDTPQIYRYLHASDVHLIPKGDTHYVVVSSTLCQCLGALCPTVAPATRHFEMLPAKNGVAPAVLYTSVDELVEKLRRLIEDEDFRRGVLRMAEEYVRQNSSGVVAARLKQLMV